MKSEPGDSGSPQEVKRALSDEFRRVARMEADASAAPSRRRWIALLAVIGAVCVPAGFAVAELGDDDAGFDASQVDPELLGPPAHSEAPGSRGMATGEGDTWVVSRSAGDKAVEVCRSGARPASECGLVLALDDGAIEPGSYSQRDLEAAVQRAGYEWDPAD